MQLKVPRIYVKLNCALEIGTILTQLFRPGSEEIFKICSIPVPKTEKLFYIVPFGRNPAAASALCNVSGYAGEEEPNASRRLEYPCFSS